jgi:hypothetical protein
VNSGRAALLISEIIDAYDGVSETAAAKVSALLCGGTILGLSAPRARHAGAAFRANFLDELRKTRPESGSRVRLWRSNLGAARSRGSRWLPLRRSKGPRSVQKAVKSRPGASGERFPGRRGPPSS